jgi:hypothetical protein
MGGNANLFQTIRRAMYGSGQKVAYTGTAGSTTPMPVQANSILVWLSTAGYVRVGGTATTADLPLPANAPVIIPIDSNTGAGVIVSAIQDASGGNMYAFAMVD